MIGQIGYFSGHGGYVGIDRVHERVERVHRRVQPLNGHAEQADHSGTAGI